jgi:NAD(P)-dependent dehydrogenase (short-subunit alcohol dehydrogenase family)
MTEDCLVDYNPMDLTGKRIVVTGASSGIGRACAILASRLGASVVLVARDEKRLGETLGQMTGGGHVAISFDLDNLENFEALFKQCASEKKLDGVVHAAGIGPAMPIQSISLALMREVMNINYFAFMELVKWFSKKKYSSGGSIVGISSVSGVVGWQGVSLYGGSKGAMDSSVRSLAIELASKKIRVNSVVPSFIRTTMNDESISVGGDEAARQFLAKQPLGIGEPKDVANAVVFLLSDAARFITGTQLVVDGGYLAQ